MNEADRFLTSFSDPQSWPVDQLHSRSAFLFVKYRSEEAIVEVDLTKSAHSNKLVCQVITSASGPEVQTPLNQLLKVRLKEHAGERVYVAGDRLPSIDIDDLARDYRIDVIHRNLAYTRSLITTDSKLNRLNGKKLKTESLTIINGLPSTEEAVNSLGLFAGDPDAWLTFHSNVEDSLPTAGKRLYTKDDFINELLTCENDLLVLIAHSDGTTVYLNGEKISLDELEALPSRTVGSQRPRVAVLLSCFAGLEPIQTPAWKHWFSSQRQRTFLADLLVRKHFVDKVVAPQHSIRTTETLETLRIVLGDTTTGKSSLPKRWVNWAELLTAKDRQT